jgi:hypothetical protein
MIDGPILFDVMLDMCAAQLDDAERNRIANENRLRTILDTSEHGFGKDPDEPLAKHFAEIVENMKAIEHQSILNLQRAVKQHPLGFWVVETKGVGLKQGGRLLATLRDPYWHDSRDRETGECLPNSNRPRGLRELYALAGMDVTDGGVAPVKQKGVKAHWNPLLRQRLWLVADKCIQVTASPYRQVYDASRERYAEAVHLVPCKRCGPSGKPAKPGSPLSLGHQHARARRIMGKEILRDIWEAARKLHEA